MQKRSDQSKASAVAMQYVSILGLRWVSLFGQQVVLLPHPSILQALQPPTE